MRVELHRILTPKEWGVTAGGLLAAGLIYALLVRPSLELSTELDKARTAKAEADRVLNQAHLKYERLHRQIARAEEELAELGGAPPRASEKDLQIARLTSLAQVCGITIDQYSPLDTVDDGNYCAFFVQFVGRGDFRSVQSYFERIETELDFVDLTHFTISSSPTDPGGVCSVAWSCQINGTQTDGAEPPQSVHSPSERPASMEVALHGP